MLEFKTFHEWCAYKAYKAYKVNSPAENLHTEYYDYAFSFAVTVIGHFNAKYLCDVVSFAEFQASPHTYKYPERKLLDGILVRVETDCEISPELFKYNVDWDYLITTTKGAAFRPRHLARLEHNLLIFRELKCGRHVEETFKNFEFLSREMFNSYKLSVQRYGI